MSSAQHQWQVDICGCTQEPMLFIFLCCYPQTECQTVYTTFSFIPQSYPFWRSCCYCMCPCIVGPINRYKLRKFFGIKGNLCFDIVAYCLCYQCCHTCALIQEYLEIKKRIEEQAKYKYNWLYMNPINSQTMVVQSNLQFASYSNAQTNQPQIQQVTIPSSQRSLKNVEV